MKSAAIVYVEMPLTECLKRYPFLAVRVPILQLMAKDPEYIARISPDGKFEFGYKSDSWHIS